MIEIDNRFSFDELEKSKKPKIQARGTGAFGDKPEDDSTLQ